MIEPLCAHHPGIVKLCINCRMQAMNAGFGSISFNKPGLPGATIRRRSALQLLDPSAQPQGGANGSEASGASTERTNRNGDGDTERSGRSGVAGIAGRRPTDAQLSSGRGEDAGTSGNRGGGAEGSGLDGGAGDGAGDAPLNGPEEARIGGTTAAGGPGDVDGAVRGPRHTRAEAVDEVVDAAAQDSVAEPSEPGEGDAAAAEDEALHEDGNADGTTSA